MNEATPIEQRIYAARRAWRRERMQPEAIYLGQEDFRDLRTVVSPDEMFGLTQDPPRYQGLRVYVVCENRHFRLVGEDARVSFFREDFWPEGAAPGTTGQARWWR